MEIKYPSAAHMMVTNACNLACDYCYHTQDTGSVMDKTTIKNSIDFLIKSAKLNGESGISIVLFGGEPSLEPTICKLILQTAKEKCDANHMNLDLQMITNGVFANGVKSDFYDFLTAWKNSGVPIDIQVTIDTNRESHDMHRYFHDKSGSYDIVVKNLKELLNFKSINEGKNCAPYIDIHLHSVITPDGVPLLYQSYLKSLELGFKGIWIMPLHEVEWTSNKIETYKGQLEMIADHIEELVRTTGDMDYYKYFASLSKRATCHPDKPCGAGYTLCQIGTDGSIYACQRLQDMGYLGNVNTLDLDNENHISKFNEDRKVFLLYGTDELIYQESCKYCDNYECYRCIGANYEYHKNMLLGFPDYCMLAKAEKEVRVNLQKRILENDKKNLSSDDIYGLLESLSDAIKMIAKSVDDIRTKIEDLDTNFKNNNKNLDAITSGMIALLMDKASEEVLKSDDIENSKK